MLDLTKEIERKVIQEHNNLKTKRCEIVTETDEELDEEKLYFKNNKLEL